MGIKILGENRKARYEYNILESLEAGIELKGTEVKSVRKGKFNINDSYCQIKKGDVILVNAHISKYDQGNLNNHDELRDRRLLLHKSEIRKWSYRLKKEERLTLIPLKLYLKAGLVKIEVALCQGKKLYDKREDEKKREEKLSAQKALKSNGVV